MKWINNIFNNKAINQILLWRHILRKLVNVTAPL
nr:MAG TPA: hypothetical protein [Caudoviricetes sp.]